MNDIMYKYALLNDTEIIDIDSLTKSVAKDNTYRCIGCGNELIPKLGNVRVHHFSHHSDESCSKETYLHKLGKLVFLKNYLDCIENNSPFYIEYLFIKECSFYKNKFKKICNYKEEQKYSLTELFPYIEYQKKEDGFIPDLLLIDKNRKNKIFIEIFVTHAVTQEKIDSNNRIIEIKINSEADIGLITQNILSYKDDRITFYNIQKTNVKENCNGQCRKTYDVLILNNNGKIIDDTLSLNEIDKPDILYYRLLEDNEEITNELIRHFSAKCAKRNLVVRNCNLCRYNMLDKYKKNKDEPIYCKFLSFTCSSLYAEECESYVQDYRIVERINSEH